MSTTTRLVDEQPSYWRGIVEKHCNICDRDIRTLFIDGRTRGGRWAIMCPGCARVHGKGVGPGKGQQYELQEDGRWLKTA